MTSTPSTPDPAADLTAGSTAVNELDVEPPCMAEVITLARSAPAGPRDPASKRSLRELYEADVACISGHLATMQTHVFPLIRRVLPDGRERVAELGRLSRDHERLLRVVHAQLRGDTHTKAGIMSRLQLELGELVATLQAAEADIAERLEAVLAPEETVRLSRRLGRAGAHAPTRPHPHATHRAGMRRLSFRLCTLLDRTLDAMESRTVRVAQA